MASRSLPLVPRILITATTLALSGVAALGAGERVHSFQYEGPSPTRFQEAPALAVRVASGELPPVQQRLPAEPLVIAPVERIGKYGGTWRRAFTGPVDFQNIDRIQHDHVIYYDMDGKTLVPHIAKSWQVDEGGRIFTFHLRAGMKWSDGHRFTAGDFVFAYEKLILNDELVPAKPTWLRSGGELGKVVALDDLTVQYRFARPYHTFLEAYAGLLVAGQSARGKFGIAPYAPAHYLKRFHPDFVDRDELTRQAESQGLDTWVQLFLQRSTSPHNPQLPVVAPWKTVQPMTSELFLLERNPFYWAVDSAGNQLPYIDRIAMRFAAEEEVLNLRAISGEIDMQHRHIHLAKVPLLKRNASKGNYRVLLWPGSGGMECAVFFNQTYDGDEEVARWLRHLEFRRALSLAIDRDAINETIFLGTGTPRAFVCPAGSRYYPGPEYERKDAVYDPQQARAILDRIGLAKKDRAGFRLRTDGKGRLTLSLAAVSAAFLDFEGIAQAVTDHWKDVGLRINLTIEQRALHQTRTRNNQHQLSLWGTGGSENIWTYPLFVVPRTQDVRFAPLVGQWYQSHGQRGIEPTGDIKRLLDLYEEGQAVPLAQRIEIGREIWRIHVNNLYLIGTVGLSPAFNGVVVVKNNFRNVPQVAPNSAPLQNPGIARTEQFFFDN